jgi:hypothetical protein
MINYEIAAKNDAKDFIREHVREQIIENFIRVSETPIQLYKYNVDDDLTYQFSDEDYSPKEAVELLEQLSDYEETDRGLFEDKDWRDMLSGIAAFTYKNAVMSFIDDLLTEINGIDIQFANDEVIEEIVRQNHLPDGLDSDEREWFNEDKEDYVTSQFSDDYESFMTEELESQINGILERK